MDLQVPMFCRRDDLFQKEECGNAMKNLLPSRAPSSPSSPFRISPTTRPMTEFHLILYQQDQDHHPSQCKPARVLWDARVAFLSKVGAPAGRGGGSGWAWLTAHLHIWDKNLLGGSRVACCTSPQPGQNPRVGDVVHSELG